ncbi:MAG: hypothetical protein IKF82_03520 [Bacilli bacterium]|nr:hypothetical protein [Bacilli bacterium]MBR3209317.1 hypothetical protein [Bacilli bacterium]
MKNLYIDFDGVICNTIEISYKMLAERGIDLKDSKKVEDFYKNLDWEFVLNSCDIINDGMENIKKICNSGKFNVAILTHVHSMNEITSKVSFIRKYLRDVTIIPVPKSISKTRMINARFSILVDDYPVNLSEWVEAGGIGVRFDLDMQGKGFLVIDHLDDLLELF